MRARRSHRSPKAPSRAGVGFAAVAGSALAALVVASLAFAGFNSVATGGPMSVTTKRIFSGSRSSSPSDLRDASSGAASNKSDPLAYDDGIVAATGNWANAYSATRFFQADFSDSRPAGVQTSSVSFNIKYASKGGGGSGNACIYKIEVRRASDDGLLGTLDHSASPLCSTGTTYRVVNEDISAYVASTDVANNLRMKVFGYETGAKGWNIEYATVTGTSYSSWTLFDTTVTDQSTGSAVTTPWSIATAEASGAAGTIYTDATNWPSAAPAGTKYLQVTFDHPDLPAGAVVQSVTLKDIWRASAAVTNGGTLCNYFEVYNGASLVETHGGTTQATAQSCNNSNVTWQTDNVTLTLVDTLAEANSMTIKFYYWIAPICGGGGNPTCVKSVTDQVQATFTYYLN
jgi:hypothetical protein